MSLYELAAPLNDATEAVQNLADQMDEVHSLLDAHEAAPESLTEELTSIQTELTSIRDGLTEATDWAGVAGAIQQSSTRPTEDQSWQVEAALDAAPALIDRLNALIAVRVPSFYDSLDAQGVRPDPGETLEVPRRRGG